MNVECGVPQGSVLGPLFVVLHINNKIVVCNFQNTKKQFYLQMTHIYVAMGKTWDNMVEFVSHKLTLKDKIYNTSFLILCSEQLNQKKKLMMNDVQLERVCDINFLGVIIDNELWWKPHINYVKAKL